MINLDLYVHLVLGPVSAAADDVGDTVALERDGVLADLLEPGELDVAGAQAVDALALVGADDDVADGGAVLEDEDSVLLAALALAGAGDAAVVADPAGVEGLAGLDALGLREGPGVDGLGDAALVAEAGHGRGHGGEEGEDLGGMHCQMLLVKRMEPVDGGW